MRAKVDLEKRLITASIGDLIDTIPNGSRSLGLHAQIRAEMGQKIHRRYRREREASMRGFTGETAVELTREVDGYSAHIRGRIDGIISDESGLTVEEVKSVTLSAWQMRKASPKDFPEYCAQALLYALCLADRHRTRPIRVKLILYSVLDESRRELELPFVASEVALELDGLLRAALAEAELDRKRSNLRAQVAEKLSFPYPRQRPHQEELTGFFLNGLRHGRPVLAMAPTGIGKTVCALLAGLRFSLANNGLLFFLTAKTIQQDLVTRTFVDIVAASDLGEDRPSALTLRAKESMCPPGSLLCHPETCPFLDGFFERVDLEAAMSALSAEGPSIRPDAVFEYGEANRLCPFELSLLLASRVDLVICDYNYVYDPSISLGLLSGEPGSRPAVAILDEAHNLFDRARGYFSPFVGWKLLREALHNLENGCYLPPEQGGGQLAFLEVLSVIPGEALLTDLVDFCQDLEKTLIQTYRDAAADEQVFLEDRTAMEPNRELWTEIAERAVELMIRFALYKFTHGLIVPRDPLWALLRIVLKLRTAMLEEGAEFVSYVAGSAAADGAGVGVLCLNPASRLEKSNREMLGIVAMSATLRPLSYYRDVLGFAALDPDMTSAPSPFPEENRRIVIVPTVSTAYRQRERHLGEIAALIRDIVRIQPGRYIAFFPSFSFLAQVRERLELPRGQVQAQLPDMSNTLRRQVLNKFSKGKGAQLLLAVMGGVFAEGIDLPGEALIGGIVVGPGLPAVGFERELMRAYFEENFQHGFAYSMLYPGMQRVIQSAGRVIRSMEDRGVIALLGSRFTEPAYSECLPPDWYKMDSRELVTRDPVKPLTEFWKNA